MRSNMGAYVMAFGVTNLGVRLVPSLLMENATTCFARGSGHTCSSHDSFQLSAEFGHDSFQLSAEFGEYHNVASYL